MLATAVGPACTQLSSEVLSRVSETLSSPSGRVRTAGRKVPGPVHQEAGAGSPRTTHAHRPATGRPHPERPSLSLAFMRLPVRVSVASRCPVVPHARWVHFFQIQRRGSNAQTERLAGQPLTVTWLAAAVLESGKSPLCQVASNGEAFGFGKVGHPARGRRHALTPV